jgi:hypothetical protein
LVQEEVIRADYRDLEGCQRLVGEVTNVGGDDRVGPAAHGRCENVTVVGVGERECLLEDLPALEGASLKVSFIAANRLATTSGGRSGWISRTASVASARIRPDQRGRYSSRSATRSSVSASAIGTSTHASRSAVYRGNGYSLSERERRRRADLRAVA